PVFTSSQCLTDGGGGSENFHSRHPSCTVLSRQQPHGNDSQQRHGEFLPDLFLLIIREVVNDTVKGMMHIDGMQRGENQMPGLSGGNGSHHGFLITHFTNENYIRALPYHMTKRIPEAIGIITDFALI